MATEAEFEREATQMLSNMGLKDPDSLNFFQTSSNYTSGNEKWKEGFRKPASPTRIRRFRSAPREPRTEVDGSAMRKHSVPVNGTHTRTSNSRKQATLDVPCTSEAAKTGPVQTASFSHHYVARTKSAPENGHRSPDGVGTGTYVENGEQRNATSPRHQYLVQPSFRSASSVKTVTPGTTSKPATIVKVKSTHIPVPVARTVPVQTVTKLPGPTPKHASTFSVTEGKDEKKSSTGTKVLYARKPSLKLLSVSTSTSTKVQSVADSSKSDHPPPRTHQKSTSHHHHPATTQPLSKSDVQMERSVTSIPSGAQQMKQPLSPSATGHVYQAYDRLEGYREIVLSSPDSATSDGRSSNPKISGIIRSASPTRCSSTNSDASQGSNVSAKSSASSSAHDKQVSGHSSAIPRLHKRSAPSSVSSSGSRSRTPTPTGHPYRKRSVSHSPVQPVADESLQESHRLSSFAANMSEKQKNGNLSKLSLEHPTSTASPEPEIVAMSILATNTVQALGTLMEVVTPTTSTENFDLFNSRELQDSSSCESGTKKGHNVSEEKLSSPASTLEKTQSSIPVPALEKPKSSTSWPAHENSHRTDDSKTLPSSSVSSVLRHSASSSKQKTGIPSYFTPKQKEAVSKPPPISSRNRTPLNPVTTSPELPSPKQSGVRPATTPSAKITDMNGQQHDSREEETSSDACLEDDDNFFGEYKRSL